MFLCRESELSKLNNHYNDDYFECVIIYGRRRIGKTALINEFVKDKDVIYFPALNSNSQDNLIALSKSINNYIGLTNIYETPVFQSFDSAFNQITTISKDKRVIFVIDELPSLVNSDNSILSRLQHLIDHDWSNTKLFLILCGSSMSFMENEVLSEKSPLFGRRTMQLHVKPLSYLDTARFNPHLSFEDNTLIYGITGGIPHYINKLSVKTSIKDALINNFFDTSSYLFEEPINLLKQELRQPSTYNSIITAIANGNAKLNNIANATHMDTSTVNKYLTTLINMGIVKKEEPIIDKSHKKVLYRINDYFFKFWYRFVPNNMISISSETISNIYDAVIGSYLSDYMGLVFEDICKEYLVNYAKDLPFQINKIGQWWGNDQKTKKEVQLDIVAIKEKSNNETSKTSFIIGSCKYTNEKVDIDEYKLIKEYSSIITNDNDICYYYMFSKSGFTDELLKLSNENNNIRLIPLNELYASLRKI